MKQFIVKQYHSGDISAEAAAATFTELAHALSRSNKQIVHSPTTLAEVALSVHLYIVFDTDSDTVVGMCRAWHNIGISARSVQIHDAVVLPRARACGVARLLIEHALGEARAQSCTFALLTSKPSRGLEAMYVRAGFRVIARAVNETPGATNLFRKDL